MKLYSYWRSSAAYRVRIALGLKNIPFEMIPIHLVKEGGQHLQEPYAALNPQKLVPILQLPDGTVLTQSMAILEYLEDVFPDPALLPKAPEDRAFVRSLCQIIASDIHPINNLRVLKYLTGPLAHADSQKTDWYRHWIHVGFDGFENMLKQRVGQHSFCYGTAPTLADVCLLPQIYNAARFEVDMTPYPLIQKIATHCHALSAFETARPENQPDAE